MSPHVGAEVAGLVEALPALRAHEVSRAGLRPGRPCAAVAGVGERKTRLVRLTRRDRTCPRAPGDAVGLPPGSAGGPGTRTAVSERRSQRIEACPCDSPAARPCCSHVCGLRVAGRSAGRRGPRQRHGRQIEWHGVAAPGTGTRSQQGRATDSHPPGPCCGPHAVPRGQEATPGNEPYSVHRPHVPSANPLGFAGKRTPTPRACLPASRSRPPRRRPRFTGGAPPPPEAALGPGCTGGSTVTPLSERTRNTTPRRRGRGLDARGVLAGPGAGTRAPRLKAKRTRVTEGPV